MLNIEFIDNNESEGKLYLVGIDDIELLEDGSYQIVFDGIENKWFQEFQDQNLLQVYEKMTPNTFVGNFRGQLFHRIMYLKNLDALSRWMMISVVEKKTEFEVTQYIENTEEPQALIRYISTISILRSKNPTALKLNTLFSWASFQDASEQELKYALKKNYSVPVNTHKLNVYNVGQGSLSAITTEDNIPLIYFDIGGGFIWNYKTYPQTLKLCFTVAKTIIISHWDGDHIETARRYSYSNWAQFIGKNWIVPKQDLTPFYSKLLSKMATTGNVLVWPNSLPSLPFWAGKIIKCIGPDKNHSGLALIVVSTKNSIKRVLHPADVAYIHIPNYSNLKLDGLVATHHGAEFDINNNPIPTTKNGAIAYSYAITKKYGHPKKNFCKCTFKCWMVKQT